MKERQIQIVFMSLLMGISGDTPSEVIKSAFQEVLDNDNFWEAMSKGQAIRSDPGAAERLIGKMMTDEVMREYESSVGGD